MKKVIRLTESELNRIIKKIIKEEGEDSSTTKPARGKIYDAKCSNCNYPGDYLYNLKYGVHSYGFHIMKIMGQGIKVNGKKAIANPNYENNWNSQYEVKNSIVEIPNQGKDNGMIVHLYYNGEGSYDYFYHFYNEGGILKVYFKGMK